MVKPAGIKEQLRAAGQDNILDSMGANAGTATAPPTETRSRGGKTEGLVRSRDVALIPLNRIQPDPQQPRKEFAKEEITRLAESIKARGQLQPIQVKWDEAAKVYRILIGERRYRAASEAGLEMLECKIHEGDLGEPALRAIQLIENLHRVDLSDVEKAKAMKGLIDAHGWSQRTLATELNLKQSSIARLLSLLTLAPEIQDKVESGEIPTSTASHIAQIKDPALQAVVANEVLDSGLDRDQTKALVESRVGPAKRGRGAAAKAPKAKAKAKPQLKTEEPFNDNGYKFLVTNRRGIKPEELVTSLEQWILKIKSKPGYPG